MDTRRNESPLTSWKEIGAYLQRNEATARRWEKEEALPIYRHSHKSRSSVYAYPSEIDAWRISRKVIAESAPPERPSWRWPAFAATMVLCLIMIGNGVRPVSAQSSRLRGAKPGQQFNTLVWSSPGYLDGAVSADGRYLAHNLDGDLAVREIASGADRRITHKDKGSPGHVENMAISRDGKQVAYAWYIENDQRYEVRLANLKGDPAPRRLYDSPDVMEIDPFDWSPDGKWIVVNLYRKDHSSQVGLISIPDGSLRVLKTLDPNGVSRIFFSPDGKYLGYTGSAGDAKDRYDLFTLSMDGVETAEPAHPGKDKAMGWSPDGTRLLFTREMASSVGLWAQPFADGKLQGAPALIKADIGPAEAVGVTRAGALYYAEYRSLNSYDFWKVQIARVDFEAGKFLSSPSDVDKDENSLGPSWSPDGKFLAYTSPRGEQFPSEPSIVIRSAETGQVVRVLRSKLKGFGVAHWAPDGRSFLVGAYNPSIGRTGVFEIDAESGGVSTVFLDEQGHSALSPQWSPDKKTVYFMRGDAKGDAFIRRDVASGNEKEIIRRDWLAGPNLSLDGRYLASASADAKTKLRSMLLIPSGGGEAREVMSVAGDGNPRERASLLRMLREGSAILAVIWAPDSRSFLTTKRLADPAQNDEVWRIFVDGEAPRKLNLTLDRRIAPGGISLHPDGRLAYSINETGAWQREVTEVWVLENFLNLGGKASGR